MPRPKTLHRGASDERDAIRRKIQSLRLKCAVGSAARSYMDALIEWIDKRVPRAKARKGGL